MTDIEKLEASLAAATPGPWPAPRDIGYGVHLDDAGVFLGNTSAIPSAQLRANATLIVAAVNALPGLIEEVRKLRAASDLGNPPS